MVLEADGGLQFDPDPGFVGVDRFTYQVTDGEFTSGPVEALLSISDQELVLNEIVASNREGLLDAFGTTSDWIEVKNNDLLLQDLRGYYLTDDPNDLTKWRVPAETLIAPGEFHVLHASGFDLVTESGELHTNFGLSSGGEYLALVRPDGTSIASEIAPGFPAQSSDVAYGVGEATATTRWIDEGSAARVSVPLDGGLGDTWVTPEFDASAWQGATTGIGFAVPGNATTVAGFEVQFVNLIGGRNGAVDRASLAEQILDGTTDPDVYLVGSEIRTTTPSVNYGGLQGTFESNFPWPEGTVGNFLDNFVMRFTTTVTIPEGDWTIGFGGSDGGILRLGGVSFLQTISESGDNLVDGDGELRYEFPRGFNWSRATFHVGPGGVTVPLELIYFEQISGDGIELAIAPGHRTLDVDPNHWALLEDGVFGWQLSTSFAPDAPRFEQFVATDLSASMFEQASSAYLRVPFNVDDASAIDQLRLAMQYDDAFVAYLNGQEVARTGISGTPMWNSVADADRADDAALVWESFDLTQHRGALRDGDNLLAIHVLNASAAANGLLASPRLEGVSLTPSSVGFLATPTPGAENGLVAQSVLAPPVFSQAGGTYTTPIDIELQSDFPNGEIRYTIDHSAPTQNSLLYRGPIALRTGTEIRARAFGLDHVASPIVSQTFAFAVDEAFTHDVANRPLQQFDSDLPILVIDTQLRAPNQNTFRDATVLLHEPDATGRASLVGPADVVSRAAIKIRGSSSSGFAKSPYSLELRNDGNDRDRDLSLAGLPADSDWVLNGPYTFDRSFTRNAAIYDLSNQIGRYASRTKFVEVFLNRDDFLLSSDDYVGIYVLTEKLKASPDRIPIEPVSPHATAEPEIRGGYIFKIDRADPNDTGFQVELGPQDVETPGRRTILYVDPKEADVEFRTDNPFERPEQVAYVTNYFNEFNAAVFSPGFTHPEFGHYSNYIDVDAWIDHHILNELTWNVDAFVLSSYFFLPADGKLQAGPIWDFDRSQESADGRDDNPQSWTGPRFAHWWGRLFEDPDFQQAWTDRWQTLRDGLLSRDNILGTIDRLAGEVAESQARNLSRWGHLVPPRTSSGFRSRVLDGTWEGEVEHQKTWHYVRLEWIDSQLLTRPVWQQADASAWIHLEGPSGAEIYFTVDGSDPRLPGGEIAPQAQRYDGPIDPAGVTELVARSFDPTFDSTFVPANEPWSGPISVLPAGASPIRRSTDQRDSLPSRASDWE